MAIPVFDTYAKLSLDSKEYDDKLKEEGEKTKSFGAKLGEVLGGVGKLVGSATLAAVTAAGAGIVTMVTQATKSYADYEQLIGGVETLFGESAGIIEDYASVAYKTAGISANAYMNQVTSFSARLLQSLGGDTEEAAKIADIAIIDMSDNANKMGSDITSIQAAYQGFSKANWTMLDNLKLGYGGSATEMARLVTDAGLLNGVMEVTADNINSIPFDIIIKSIHKIQEEMGITGTTAKEAQDTISGSFGMMKASCSDLLTSLAGGGIGLSQAIANLTDSVLAFLDNVVPVVVEALYGIGDLIQGLVPVIADKLPELIDRLVPMLIDTAVYLVNSIIAVLPQLVDTIASALIDVLPQLVSAAINLLDALLVSVVPAIIAVAIQLVIALGQGIADNIGKIAGALIELVSFIVKTVVENLPTIVKLGLQIILGIITGILENLHTLMDTIVEIIPMIVIEFVQALPEIVELGGKIILALIEGILLAIPMLLVSIGRAIGLVKTEIKDGTDEMTGSVKSAKTDIDAQLSSLERDLGVSKSGIKNQTGEIVNVTKDSVSQAQNYANQIENVAKLTKGQIETILNELGPVFNAVLGATNTFAIAMNRDITSVIDKLRDLSAAVATPTVDPSGVESGCASIVSACERASSALASLSNSSAGAGSFGGGHASGGWMEPGTTYLVGELGPELVTPSRREYVHTAEETSTMMMGKGDIIINIDGDVYDNEMSVRRKLRSAVLDVLQEQMAYG